MRGLVTAASGTMPSHVLGSGVNLMVKMCLWGVGDANMVGGLTTSLICDDCAIAQ